jgi:hypothetical protein
MALWGWLSRYLIITYWDSNFFTDNLMSIIGYGYFLQLGIVRWIANGIIQVILDYTFTNNQFLGINTGIVKEAKVDIKDIVPLINKMDDIPSIPAKDRVSTRPLILPVSDDEMERPRKKLKKTQGPVLLLPTQAELTREIYPPVVDNYTWKMVEMQRPYEPYVRAADTPSPEPSPDVIKPLPMNYDLIRSANMMRNMGYITEENRAAILISNHPSHFVNPNKKIILSNEILKVFDGRPPVDITKQSPLALWPGWYQEPTFIGSSRVPLPVADIAPKYMSTPQLNYDAFFSRTTLNMNVVNNIIYFGDNRHISPQEFKICRERMFHNLAEVQKRQQILNDYAKDPNNCEKAMLAQEIAIKDQTWEIMRRQFHQELEQNFIPLHADIHPWKHLGSNRMNAMIKFHTQNQGFDISNIYVHTRGIDLFIPTSTKPPRLPLTEDCIRAVPDTRRVKPGYDLQAIPGFWDKDGNWVEGKIFWTRKPFKANYRKNDPFDY